MRTFAFAPNVGAMIKACPPPCKGRAELDETEGGRYSIECSACGLGTRNWKTRGIAKIAWNTGSNLTKAKRKDEGEEECHT